jgi:hypothetical protein
MSRSDCKPIAETYDFAALRTSILIPSGVEDTSLRTDGPFAYRDLDECLVLIDRLRRGGYQIWSHRLYGTPVRIKQSKAIPRDRI